MGGQTPQPRETLGPLLVPKVAGTPSQQALGSVRSPSSQRPATQAAELQWGREKLRLLKTWGCQYCSPGMIGAAWVPQHAKGTLSHSPGSYTGRNTNWEVRQAECF